MHVLCSNTSSAFPDYSANKSQHCLYSTYSLREFFIVSPRKHIVGVEAGRDFKVLVGCCPLLNMNSSGKAICMQTVSIIMHDALGSAADLSRLQGYCLTA